jgi:hypothetical protein
MNFYSATLTRLGQRFRRTRIIERRAYVFILVPFHVRGNGHAKGMIIVDPILDAPEPQNGRAATPAATTESIPTENDGGKSKETELDYRLVWTWFLPNPLWPRKNHK